MIFLRKVVGDSMLPNLKEGQVVFCHQIRDFRVGQVAIAFVDGREVIKRITKIEYGKIYLSGDNQDHSHKGKYYATVTDRKIAGIVFWPRI